MISSEAIDKIAPALVAMQATLEHAVKDRANPHFKSQYAGLDGVRDAIREPLAKNDLCVVQSNRPADGGVEIVTTIVHKSGQWVEDDGLYVPADRSNAQGFGSALTYARRYALMAMTGLTPTDDDDGNAAAAAPPKSRAAPKPRSKAKPKTITKAQQASLVELAVAAGMSPEVAQERASNVTVDEYDDKVGALKARIEEQE